jgi:hypothetical protein
MKAAASKRIALLVESSHGGGRAPVHGVAAFLREQGCDWLIDHETQRLEAGPPAWLAKWRGDGVIARLHSERVAKAVSRLRVPVVDVLNALPPSQSVHLAHVNEAAIASIAFEHLRGGLQRHPISAIDPVAGTSDLQPLHRAVGRPRSSSSMTIRPGFPE